MVAKFSIIPKIACPVCDPPSANICFRSNWKHCTPIQFQAFRDTVSRLLPSLPLTWDRPSVDFIVSRISEVLLLAALRTFPSIKFRKHVRPGSNGDLKQTHLRCKRAYRAWRKIGRPSDPLDKCRVEYKLEQEERVYLDFKRQQFDIFLSTLDLDDRKLFLQLTDHQLSQQHLFVLIIRCSEETRLSKAGLLIFRNSWFLSKEIMSGRGDVIVHLYEWPF